MVFVWYSVQSYNILHMTYLQSVLIDKKCVTTIAMNEIHFSVLFLFGDVFEIVSIV